MLLYGQPEEVDYFFAFMREHPEVRFSHPNFDAAPWHVIAEVVGADGAIRRAHFWPHKMKVCADDEMTGRPLGKAQIGVDAMHAAIAECRSPERIDVVE